MNSSQCGGGPGQWPSYEIGPTYQITCSFQICHRGLYSLSPVTLATPHWVQSMLSNRPLSVAAIIRRRSYLHTESSSICIRPSSFAFHCALSVCLQRCLWAGHVSCLVKGWERADKGQKFKTRQRICFWMVENPTSRVRVTNCRLQKMRPKTDI